MGMSGEIEVDIAASNSDMDPTPSPQTASSSTATGFFAPSLNGCGDMEPVPNCLNSNSPSPVPTSKCDTSSTSVVGAPSTATGEHTVIAVLESAVTEGDAESAPTAIEISQKKGTVDVDAQENQSPGSIASCIDDEANVHLKDLTLDDRNIYHNIDEVLKCMTAVDKELSLFRAYINAQNGGIKPLHRWEPYQRYVDMEQSAVKLDKAVDLLEIKRNAMEKVELPRKFAVACFAQVLKRSISTSNTVASAMRVTGGKMAIYEIEMEHTYLSAQTKEKAKSVVAAEISKLLKHTSGTCESVYSATDLLQKVLCRPRNVSEEKMDPMSPKEGTWGIYMKQLATCMIVIGTVIIASFYIPGLPSGCQGIERYNSIVTATQMDRMQTSEQLAIMNSIADSAGANHSMTFDQLTELDKRVSGLEKEGEAQASRIDNIWDALGPPNESGEYSYRNYSTQHGEDLEHQIKKLSQRVEELSAKHHEEMVQMRKLIHRNDIRMAREINHLKRSNSGWLWKRNKADAATRPANNEGYGH